MSNFRFTGHPFVDAGIAGMAAILESNGNVVFGRPEEMTTTDVERASDLLIALFSNRIITKAHKAGDTAVKPSPLCVYLLQEVLPGSSWDQAKGKPDNQFALFRAYVNELRGMVNAPAIGRCFLTGEDAHVLIDKSQMPLLASSTERPNCFPNLGQGYPASTSVALAVLFSPLSIEKTVKEDGGGSTCLIYHTANWRFMVEVAHRNLRRLKVLLASKSIEEFRSRFFKANPRSGTWKMALLTARNVLKRLDKNERPRVFVWSFNANNQSCRYECIEITSAFLTLHDHRQLNPNAYREMLYCSDTVSRLILEGRPIAKESITEVEAKKGLKNADRLTRTKLRPGWSLQRLYAQEVLNMPARLLNAVERAAEHLAQDPEAMRYCLYDYRRRISPVILASRYKLPQEHCAVFADHSGFWEDYLRAAVLWSAKGGGFGDPIPVSNSPGEIEALITQLAARLKTKHGYKRLAMRLGVGVPRQYRTAWIRLLSEGACTWEDFLAFNPLQEALSTGSYFRTRTMRDYLVAYLFGCANRPQPQEVEDEDDEEPLDMVDLEFADEEEEA